MAFTPPDPAPYLPEKNLPESVEFLGTAGTFSYRWRALPGGEVRAFGGNNYDWSSESNALIQFGIQRSFGLYYKQVIGKVPLMDRLAAWRWWLDNIGPLFNALLV